MFSKQTCELSDESQKLLTKNIEYFNFKFNQLFKWVNSEKGISNTYDYLRNNNAGELDNEIEFVETLDNDLIENRESDNETRKAHKFRITLWMAIVVIVIFAAMIIVPYLIDAIPCEDLEMNISSSFIDGSAESDEWFYVDLEKIERTATDNEIKALIQEAQLPITVYDENGQYDCRTMLEAINDRIISNPIYGYLVACGLNYILPIVYKDEDVSLQKLNDFLETTSYSNSESFYKWVRRWLIRTGFTLYTTDEYKDYADAICLYLSNFYYIGVHDFKATAYWAPNSVSGIPQEHFVSYPKTITGQTFVMSYRRYVIGFWLENGNMVYSARIKIAQMKPTQREGSGIME